MTRGPGPEPGARPLLGPDLLDAVAARTTAPGGGAVSALVTGLAAALAAMSARFSGGELAALAGRGDEIRAHAQALADQDLVAYGSYLQARRSGRDSGQLTAALDEATRVPLEIATVAAEVTGLALRLVADGNPRLRGDAAAAVLLAAAATRASAVLVCENLSSAPGDPRLAVAREAVAIAGHAQDTLLARYPQIGPLVRP